MACAEWFDSYSKQVIACLFGCDVEKGQSRGLFGTCEGYVICFVPRIAQDMYLTRVVPVQYV